MNNKKIFRRGTSFPNEGFVQAAIERHFADQGFSRLHEGNADLVCRHPTSGEEWLVEAKGETTSVGLDFRTGLGQLLQQMGAATRRYAVAVPETSEFIRQCRQVPNRVRVVLQIHWLIIDAGGSVRIVSPGEPL
jgi:hypothetical protein